MPRTVVALAPRRSATTAAITPASTELRIVTTVGVPAMICANQKSLPPPGGTPMVMPIPRRSSCALMTKNRSRSGASSRYAARMRFMPITQVASW